MGGWMEVVVVEGVVGGRWGWLCSRLFRRLIGRACGGCDGSVVVDVAGVVVVVLRLLRRLLDVDPPLPCHRYCCWSVVLQ